MKAAIALLVLATAFLLHVQQATAAEPFTFTSLAGSTGGTHDGTNTTAQFSSPCGIAVDPSGNLFVGDIGNNAIRKLTPIGDDWVVTTIAGTAGAPNGTNDGVNSQAQFYKPNGVAIDTNGNLFVVDHYNHTVRKISPSGTNWVVTTIAGLGQISGYADGTNSDARFFSPTGIAIDKAGNLFVGDTYTHTIRKITPVGTNWVVTTIAGSPLNYGYLNALNTNAMFDLPSGLTVDGSNIIYVADFGNHAIRKITPIGTDWSVTTVAGSGNMGTNNGTNTLAEFNSPADVVVDNARNLYVNDQFNNTLRKITPYGNNWAVTTIGGLAAQQGFVDAIGTNSRFKRPWGLTINTNGSLFIVDYSNQRIREGVPTLAPPPNLKIASGTGKPIVTWPLSANTFVLETTPSLFNGTAWTVVSNGIAISRNYFALTNIGLAPAAFYRLHGQ